MKEIIKLIKLNKRKDFLLFVLAEILYMIVTLITPYSQELFIDSLSQDSVKVLANNIIFILVLYVIGQLLGYMMDYYQGMSEKNVWVNIIKKSSQNAKFYDMSESTRTRDDVSQQLGQTYEIIKDFCVKSTVEFVINIITEIGILIALFTISPINAIAVMIFVPLFIILSRKYADKLGEYSKNTVDSMRDCRDYVADLTAISASERFRKSSFFVPIEKILNKYIESKNKQIKVESAFMNFMSYAFLNLMIISSIIIAGIGVWKGVVTVGGLYAITLYTSKFWGPIEECIDFYKEFASTKNIREEFTKYLDEDTKSYECNDISEITLKEYVSKGSSGDTLHNKITQKMSSGNIYTIMGDNGAGKTSMILAILGLSNRYSGLIDIEDFGHNNNFVYSCAEPIYSRFYADFVPDTLSKGQLKMYQLKCDIKDDKKVYIFDEPTNYLDKEHKKIVRNMIDNLRDKNKIVIVITHDKDFVDSKNDNILYLETI